MRTVGGRQRAVARFAAAPVRAPYLHFSPPLQTRVRVLRVFVSLSFRGIPCPHMIVHFQHTNF